MVLFLGDPDPGLDGKSSSSLAFLGHWAEYRSSRLQKTSGQCWAKGQLAEDRAEAGPVEHPGRSCSSTQLSPSDSSALLTVV